MSAEPGRAGGRPLVTAAFPLYRSEQFLPILLDNIRGLDYPNVEILLSDRHGDARTMARLGEALHDDRRVRFLLADDRIGWVAHYNELLRAGRGDYFCWLPHDDRVSPGYVTLLADALDRNPDAVLAFGRIHGVRRDGSPAEARYDPFPLAADVPWSLSTVMDLMAGWEFGTGVRGLFRRSLVLEGGLFMRETLGTDYSDRLWVFGAGLLGRLIEVPGVSVRKLHHEGSAHRSWRWTPARRASYILTGCRYLWAGVPGGRARRAAILRFLVLHMPRWMKRPWRSLGPSVRARVKHGLRAREDDLVS